MIINIYNSLYKKVKNQRFTIKHAVEVGIYSFEKSNILGFMREGIRCQIFEPDPVSAKKIKRKIRKMKNVQLHEYAIYNRDGSIFLYRNGESTFVSELDTSPAIVNDNYQKNESDKFVAEAKRFSHFDDGTIDLLSVDTEGCEWHVLQTLISRPLIISLETHSGKYKNPNLSKIQYWMNKNNYKKWYSSHSDTVYIKRHLSVSLFSRYF